MLLRKYGDKVSWSAKYYHSSSDDCILYDGVQAFFTVARLRCVKIAIIITHQHNNMISDHYLQITCDTVFGFIDRAKAVRKLLLVHFVISASGTTLCHLQYSGCDVTV